MKRIFNSLYGSDEKAVTLLTSNEISIQPTVTNFAFDIVCNGLKPLTRHYFFDGNVTNNKSAKCEPYSGVVGGSLISDASGMLRFKYYYVGDELIAGSGSTIPMTGSTANASITQSVISDGSRKFIVTSSAQPSENYASSDPSFAQFSVSISAGSGDVTAQIVPDKPIVVYEGGGGGGLGLVDLNRQLF